MTRRPPTPPANLRVEAASASHFLLSWDDRSDDERSFRAERRKAGTAAWTYLGQAAAGATRFESVGCLMATAYEHRVCAQNAAGASDYVAATGTTPKADPTPRGRDIAPIGPGNPRNGEGSFCRLRDGRLLFAYSRYSGHGDLDPSVVARRISADGGKTWGRDATLVSDGTHTVGHPGLARLPNSALGMSYMVIRGRHDAATLFRVSADDGETWSKPTRISDGVHGYITAPHDCLRLYGGGRLIQVCHARDSRSRLCVLVYTSDDAGATWANRTGKGLYHPTGKMNEGSIARLSRPGHLLMHCRTQSGWFWQSVSSDNGTTWGAPTRSPVRSSESPAKLYNVPGSATLVMLFAPHVDPSARGWPRGDRWILASMVSRDDGETWRGYKQIEYTGHGHWHHYPCLLFDGGHAHLAYHYGLSQRGRTHQSCRYARLPAGWFTRE